MKRLLITCDDKVVIRVDFDKETWIIKSCWVHIGSAELPDLAGKHYTELALWLQRSKFLRIVFETICETCGGAGVIETELYEGLVNCPSCRPDKP